MSRLVSFSLFSISLLLAFSSVEAAVIKPPNQSNNVLEPEIAIQDVKIKTAARGDPKQHADIIHTTLVKMMVSLNMSHCIDESSKSIMDQIHKLETSPKNAITEKELAEKKRLLAEKMKPCAQKLYTEHRAAMMLLLLKMKFYMKKCVKENPNLAKYNEDVKKAKSKAEKEKALKIQHDHLYKLLKSCADHIEKETKASVAQLSGKNLKPGVLPPTAVKEKKQTNPKLLPKVAQVKKSVDKALSKLPLKQEPKVIPMVPSKQTLNTKG